MENVIKKFILEESLTSSEGHLYIGKVEGQKAILIFPNQPVPQDTFSQFLSLPMERIQSNDVYYTYKVLGNMPISFRLIYPATEEHIRKYSSSPIYIRETYEEYLDFLKNYGHISTSWMDNIIDPSKRNVNEEILYEDQEIMIIPDYKWNKQLIDHLHLLVIFKDPALKTIRDINSHNLLIRAQENANTILATKFALDPKHVFMFFHYRPTYLRLHIHIINIKIAHEGTVSSIRAIPLHDVIHNLHMNSNYYKKDMFVLLKEAN
ncbi:uncharacterized protein Eint_101680 [Encephalitozoon intestinalis ATCC 50506]|uniref:M7GpppX diphosphatase n=1 Tax=Encephalitozoon intestinalis (strain ATCC 50506) TaxID=876142 RepID=E0S9V8_ENCIT|nr:uncharacterized protein Eint_101680 [Encephalitozoon intestinalis ATCC 50506]ADM12493.1 hypothetical protein Eint_101680 [Encephalitozoon intestinalis ATCC 50506]UTX46330.1 m7GpppX diphosphatase [Encephalitozoon intestinalis]